MPKPNPTPNSLLLRTRFSPPQLLQRFHQLIPGSLILSWLDDCQHTFYHRAFTPLITLWYLVFQRLSFRHGLTHVQLDARSGGADRLSPPGKLLSRQLRSQATTSYSDARHRLPLQVCRRALEHTAQQMVQALQLPQPFGLRLGLLDGTTCRLRPHGDIPQHFSPHTSGKSKKPAYWCVARVVAILCWATGAVIDTAIDSLRLSEQALSARFMLQGSWKGWLMAADRNFGVYFVARLLQAADADSLLRLTAARARKLARAAKLNLRAGLDSEVHWAPTRQDKCPEGLTRATLCGRLIAIRLTRRGYRSFVLYLFTTLNNPASYPVAQLVEIYGRRWNVELCLRYIKTQMELGVLECHSAEMARKEWIAGLIAYNLIRWTMGIAAALAHIPVQFLSFARARELLLSWYLHCPHHSGIGAWRQLLVRLALARLPRRRKPRPNEPRAIRPFTSSFAKLYGPRSAARRHLATANIKS